jgi:N-glycosylase/DNA lyase
VGSHAALLRVEGGDLFVRSDSGLSEDDVSSYLGLDVPYDDLIARSDLDDFSRGLLHKYEGLRILRQEPWPCAVAYVISASLSILAIEKVLGRISLTGDRMKVGGYSLHAFPHPAMFLAMERPEEDYLGRKWDYLRSLAEGVVNGTLDFERLATIPYGLAWRSLAVEREEHLMGIGPKVADCMLLFSLDKREAFPMDRWIVRGLTFHYPWLVPERLASKLRAGGAMTPKEYEVLSGRVRAYFGDAGGLLQECLFLHMRTSGASRPWA